MIESASISPVLTAHLPRQRWFAGDEAAAASHVIDHIDVLRDEWPALVNLVVRVAGQRWQVPDTKEP